MKKNNKGFTLMEMLIVVAIIAILVAVMIPTFTSALEKSREATDIANIRSTYAEAMVKYLDGTLTDAGVTSPKMTQTKGGWQYVTDIPEYMTGVSAMSITKDQTVTVTVDDEGTPTFTLK